MLRGGFQSKILNCIKDANYPVTDKKWFDTVMTQLMNDITTAKVRGLSEVYDYEMLKKVADNKHILGKELDPLNWNPNEARQLKPAAKDKKIKIQINFNNANGARFILFDAHRRYGKKFLNCLSTNLLNIEKGKTVSGKEIIKTSLEQASGIPADAYIRLASKAQTKELLKYKQ